MKKMHYLLTLALSAGVAMASTAGCELIASVDRTTIATGGGGGAGGGVGGAGGSTTSGGGQGGQGTGGSDCADEMQSGSETDVDCGGGCPACGPGKTCSEAADCESTFCVDGVCCDTVCDGACEACTAALKESAADTGTCGQAATDSACGDPQGCTAGVETTGDTCDAAGQCTDGGTSPCTPYTCNATGLSCLTACSTSSECVGTHFCNTQGGVCTVKKANGQTCQGADQCTSGNCADGVCCNNACGGTCKACNTPGSVGTCLNAPAGSTESGCTGTMACNGAGACAADDGQTCTMASQCASGHCVDGYCCNTTCTANCQACNNAATLGTCGNIAQGTVDAACGSTNTTCNATGLCKLPDGATCTANIDCASGLCTGSTLVKTCTAAP